MRLLAAILLITICSCEPSNRCEYPEVYAAGMCVLSEYEVNVEEIEYTVEVLEREVRAKGYSEVRDFVTALDMNKVAVEFIDSKLAIGCERHERDVHTCDMFISGVNYGGVDMYVQHHDCLGITALAHELMHSIEAFYLDGMVGEHMTPWFYEEYRAVGTTDQERDDIWWETVEIRMIRILTCDLESCAAERTDWVCDELEEENTEDDYSVPFTSPEEDEEPPTEEFQLP